MQESTCIAGVDVAKAELVISVEELSTCVQAIPNEAAAIRAWLGALPASSIVAMESSGTYHQLLAQLAQEAGVLVYILNARDVHMYAKAISARAKTDRLDACVIARYVREHRAHLKAWSPCSGVSQRLQQLLDRRDKLVEQLVRVRQCLRDVPELQAASKQLVTAFEDVKAQIDQLVAQLMSEEPSLERAAARLESITGVGRQSSVRLASLFGRIPFSNINAVVGYSGLDPRPNDSGTKHGKRRLSKRGPVALRKALYLMAFAACHSKLYAPFYTELKQRLSTTEALVILARKLLRTAWGVWKSGKPFDPARFTAENACKKT
ncbi:MAG: IS110 family transposase [Burkholderiaceae bacterium]|jgi:transposase|nr:IS110 family transposase [Burkholderiaceae bacterium]